MIDYQRKLKQSHCNGGFNVIITGGSIISRIFDTDKDLYMVTVGFMAMQLEDELAQELGLPTNG